MLYDFSFVYHLKLVYDFCVAKTPVQSSRHCPNNHITKQLGIFFLSSHAVRVGVMSADRLISLGEVSIIFVGLPVLLEGVGTPAFGDA